MTQDPARVYARSSAFEGLLAKVYMEIWDVQDDPSRYATRVLQFATTWLPTMFQDQIHKKIPDLDEKLADLEIRLNQLREVSKNSDALIKESIENDRIPNEIADVTDEVWHAILDVLTDAGFNFPVGKVKETRTMG